MIGITLGDPAGIGPEIIVASLLALDAATLAELVIYGDRGVLERAASALGLDHDAAPLLSRLTLVEVSHLGADQAVFGMPDLHAGRAQVAYLDAAIADCQAGRIAGLVTAPINKTWAQRAGFTAPGHTEYLAARLGAARVVMAFVGPRFKVALATIHHALAAVPRILDQQRIVDAIELGAELAARLGATAPRIGVLGLHPHAGESGLFGDEEARIIAPAIARARASVPGATIEGPLVPDAAYRLPCDLFVAQYHDQALIPIKLIDFELAVNVTLGLPGLVRTSPDHGTAYDLAGTGKARHQSFAAALDLARRLLPVA
jgi:4-hydroxythreonine-4-phosphate dehydrogenase